MNKKSVFNFSVGLLAIALLSACASAPSKTTLTKCEAKSTKKNVTIVYGDSHLSVDVKEQKVKRDEYLAFDLKPDPDHGPNDLNYETVMVTIKGKETNPDADWISASGDATTKGPLLVCVPTDQAFGTYEYLIHVDEVGTLDPRVTVEPQ